MALPPAVVILGPTGSGKSEYAMQLAVELPVEIISVDSAQVFRGMDIGTAKPTAAERSEVPHHLIDIRDPRQNYSAGEFRADCLAAIDAITARGRLPLLVGGTMLYYRSLFHGIAELPRADAALRARIDERAVREGWPALHAELAQRDPAAASRIHRNDTQRIQRALEIVELGGRVLDEAWGAAGPAPDLSGWLVWSLVPESRQLLHDRLARRLGLMLEAGFVAEVQDLHARGSLDGTMAAARTVGYRQLLALCDGSSSLAAACERALSATRQLAKRQLTWIRGGLMHPAGAKGGEFDPFAGGAIERFRSATLQWFESTGIARP
jgi:tRNA dimethylallyltransferase